MTDRISPEHRSWNMSRICSRDTSPERVVRSVLHGMGYRFRLHRKDLPGKPDIVLPRHCTVILVHGCFWHRHSGCRFAYTPKSRVEFWTEKFRQNVERDRRSMAQLRRAGWKVITIWECQTSDTSRLRSLLERRFSR